jgi:hypothetical protein
MLTAKKRERHADVLLGRGGVFLLNRASTKALDGKMPYEAYRGRKLAVGFLKTFDCVAIYLPRALKCEHGNVKRKSWKQNEHYTMVHY